jgi:hypothetical protein
MPSSPSIVPEIDRDVCLVLDDFGLLLGRAWRETDVHDANFESVITDLLDGQYTNPVRIVALNMTKGSSHDISNVVALEVRTRCEHQRRELPACSSSGSVTRAQRRKLAVKVRQPL